MSKTTLQILKEARELISDPARWTQSAYARDADGDDCSPRSDDAICWCSEGAVLKVLDDMDGDTEAVNLAIRRLSRVAGERGYVRYNDNHTHAEVLAMWDTAISTEEQRETA